MAGRFRGYLERFLSSHKSETAREPATDTELLRRFHTTGDQEAFELLVWRYGTMVLGVCRRLIRDEHLAEDAFQAVFLVLARQAKSIRGSNIAGWLFRVARRVATRAVQARRQHQELSEIQAEEKARPIEQEELSRVLDGEIARLPTRLRDPVLLCYLGGRSTEDAARELNCPRGTILSRLSAARRILAGRLRRKGLTLPVALPVLEWKPEGLLVAATAAFSIHLPLGNSSLNQTALLTEGVIRSMTRTKQLALLFAALVTTALIGGYGWLRAYSNTVSQETSQTNQFESTHNSQKQNEDNGKTKVPINSVANQKKELPGPEQLEGFVEILGLDPVIAEAVKPNSTDSPLRKLQKEVCFSLCIYMAKIEVLIKIGKWNPLDFDQAQTVAVSLPTNLLEVMDKPADKLKCYELEVKLLKGMYEFINTRVLVGSDPWQNKDIARANWLKAEVKLLKLKMEIEKAKK